MKYDFQEPCAVLDRFNVKLLLINLISTINLEVCSESNFQHRLAWTRSY